MKVLTIVVPSYNTSVHIDECIPSMIDERCIDDIEILLINDGSTDNTLELLEKYQTKYPKSIRIINKENGGHGSVINRGIHEAKGKYFKVVDGDDHLIPDGLCQLVDRLKTIDADIVYTSYYRDYLSIKKRELSCVHNIEEGRLYEFDLICHEIGSLPLHALNYRTSLLKDNDIKLTEKCFYEDKEYDLFPVPYVNTIVYYNIPTYIYRIGVVGQSVSTEKLIKNQAMLETITYHLCDFYERKSTVISKPKREYLAFSIVDVIKNMYGMYLKLPYGEDSIHKIEEFNNKCRMWSEDLYVRGNTGAVKLLRRNSFIVYSIAYIGFKIVRWRRGF